MWVLALVLAAADPAPDDAPLRLPVDPVVLVDMAAAVTAAAPVPTAPSLRLQDAPVLAVVDVERATLALFRHGLLVDAVRVGHGQVVGAKERVKDLKTPRGVYFVTHKSRGPFSGSYADYYGGHWIKLNYPGPDDAARGLEQKLITKAQARSIVAAWAKRALPPQNTKLGGGIGLHGWNGDFGDDDPFLSFGCLVLHNDEVSRVFDALPVGAPVVLR
jgi:murein L,D-transpeptidase YafK